MTPMADMSRAIRLELEKHGARLQDIPDPVLTNFMQIIGAYYADLKDEWERRGEPPA